MNEYKLIVRWIGTSQKPFTQLCGERHLTTGWTGKPRNTASNTIIWTGKFSQYCDGL